MKTSFQNSFYSIQHQNHLHLDLWAKISDDARYEKIKFSAENSFISITSKKFLDYIHLKKIFILLKTKIISASIIIHTQHSFHP